MLLHGGDHLPPPLLLDRELRGSLERVVVERPGVQEHRTVLVDGEALGEGPLGLRLLVAPGLVEACLDLTGGGDLVGGEGDLAPAASVALPLPKENMDRPTQSTLEAPGQYGAYGSSAAVSCPSPFVSSFDTSVADRSCRRPADSPNG